MTPTPRAKASALTAATDAVKHIDARIAHYEKLLASLRTRRIDAAAKAEWLKAKPMPLAEQAAVGVHTEQTVALTSQQVPVPRDRAV